MKNNKPKTKSSKKKAVARNKSASTERPRPGIQKGKPSARAKLSVRQKEENPVLKEAMAWLKDVIDIQNSCIKKEHSYVDKLDNFKKVLMHLDSDLIKKVEGRDSNKILKFIKKDIDEKAIPLINSIEELVKHEKYQMRIVSEEKHLLKEMKKDVKHRHWRAIFRIVEEGVVERSEQREFRLDVKTLKKFHKLYKKLSKVLKDARNIEDKFDKHKIKLTPEAKYAIIEDLYEILWNIQELYEVSCTYEMVFHDLLAKEKMLLQSEILREHLLYEMEGT
ncbi:hypothetical protein JW868_03925 [Candidatus Woesearchaeota archaeon]|nr:hypothetical protein [Candidatus Woesearchaeota archaeon]